MTRNNKTRSGIFAVIAGLVLLGAIASPASAQRDGRDHGNDRNDQHDRREHRQDWNGGYYRAPPVIYGGNYGYVPPPVVYGPSVYWPGLSINIR